ncbi:MAG TPA: hypothetical protein PLM75_02605 [bacterium]|mgnify:CR=1 FL=1|nr:hypothetical protein [bacterium]HPP86736.1 hypothetical protein [bacterium]
MDESLVVVMSKLKKYIKNTTGCSISMEALGVINNKVLQLCEDAARRAQADRRKIIKPSDIGIL